MAVHHGLVLAALVAIIGYCASLLSEIPFDHRIQLHRGLTVTGPDMWMMVAAALLVSLPALWDRTTTWRSGRWHDLSLAPFRALFCCLVIGWLGYLLLFSPHHHLLAPATFAAALGLFALLLLVAPYAERPRWSGGLRKADYLLFNLCLVVVAVELGLQLTAAVRPSVIFFRPSTNALERIEATRFEAGRIRYGFPVNSTGHYDEDFLPRREGQRLVVSIGDSFSAGVVHHHYHFTTVAERRLGPGATIHNMGMRSTEPPEYYHLLVNEAMPLDPTLIVINLFVGNDLSYPLYLDDVERTWRNWLDRDNVMVCILPTRLFRVAAEASALRAGEGNEKRLLRSLDDIHQNHPWFLDPMLEEAKFGARRFRRLETIRFERLWTISVKDLERRLRPLLRMRRAAPGIPLLVMLIPDEFQVEDPLWRQIRPEEASDADRDRGLRIAAEWLEREGFDFLDLLPHLRAVPPMADGRRHLYHLQDTHLNVRGNQAVGAALANFLGDHLPSP